jgi:uncharacterized protein YpuA (DUF1002 family)
MQTDNEDIQNVVNDVIDRSEEYGFTVSEDNAEECVRETAELFSIDLSEEQVQLAVQQLLDEVANSQE